MLARGANRPLEVDFRLVSATNQDLPELIKQGKFRLDLFHRINACTIHLPPLKDRLEDIRHLFDHFVEQRHPGLRLDIDDHVWSALLSYSWPGNARELRNVVERLVLLAKNGRAVDEDIVRSLLRESPQETGKPARMREYMDECERDYLEQVLKQCDWNQLRASKILDLPYSTLHRRIKRFGLRPPQN